ncbi:MAG: glycosyltransferase [Rikenellaceae bacterium]
MKQRILFCVRDFNHGGIPKCLQQLLLFIDRERYEVDIFCGDQRGAYRELLTNCNIIESNFLILLCLMNYRKESGFTRLLAIVVKLVRHLLLRFGVDILKLLLKREAGRRRGYSAAIAYAEGFPVDIVEWMECERKLLWIHSNFQWKDASAQDMISDSVLSKFSTIVCVANHIERSFLELYPSAMGRTTTLNNVMADREIVELAASQEPLHPLFDNSGFTMLSIGRIAYPKDFDKIPKIVRLLKEMGIEDIKWYIIGPGPDAEVQLVVDNIAKNKVENEVVLLGAIMNPYQYIKKSDLYVLTSQSEAYPTVINEAKILATPIVSTAFNGVEEIMSSEYGVIAPIDELHQAIYKMYSDREYYAQCKANLGLFKQDNEALLQHFYELIS